MGRGEHALTLVLGERNAELDDRLTIHLNILDRDDLRGALKPDARGQTWRGDAAVLQRLLEIYMSDLTRRPWAGHRAARARAARRRLAPPSPAAGRGPGEVAAARAAAAGVSLPRLSPISVLLKTLDGRTLTNADIAGRFVVLNFWAPWCPPCVREMPELDQFARSAAGKRAGDRPGDRREPAVEKFLAAHPVSFPISVLGYAGPAWARRLSNDPNVALPFTAVFDRSQQLAQHKFGADQRRRTGRVGARFLNELASTGAPPRSSG